MRSRLLALICVSAAPLALADSEAHGAPAPVDLLAPAADAYVNEAQPTVSWRAASSAVPLDSYVVLVDGVTVGSFDAADCSATCEAELPDALGSGRHTWQVIAVDAADGQTPSAVRAFTVDTVAPTVRQRSYRPTTINGVTIPGAPYPVRPVNCATPSKDTDVGIPLYRRLTEPLPPPGPFRIVDAGPTTERYTVNGQVVASLCALPAGAHTVSVVSSDAAGNIGTWTGSIRSDPISPVITVDGELRGVVGARKTVVLGTAPGTAVAPFRFLSWIGQRWYSRDTNSHLITFPRAVGRSEVTFGVRDAEWDVSTTTVSVVAGPKPAAGAIGLALPRADTPYVNERYVPLRMNWTGGALSYTISDSTGTRPVSGPVTRSWIPWRLRGSGTSRAPTTIRVRFDWPDPGKAYTVRTTLDLEKPRVVRARVARGRLSITARDRVSGLASVQIAKRRAKPKASVAYSRRSRIKISTARWVRVRDRAGNLSGWAPIRR